MTRTVVLVVAAQTTAMTFYKGYLKYLNDRGWKVWIVAKSEGKLESWAAAEGASAKSVSIARQPSPLSDIRALFTLVNAFREIKPDLVVSATPKASLLGLLAAYIAGVRRRVYQLWGLRLETEVGLKRVLLLIMERLTIAFSTQVLANSESLADKAANFRLIDRHRIKVLGKGSSHGVDVDRFSPEAPITPPTGSFSRFLQGSAETLVVVFIGRITRDKGIDTLLEAQRMCAESGFKFKLIVVGAPEDSRLTDKMRACDTRSLYLVDRVDDVRPYISNAHLLCLPSYREGFPNVVLEAAGLGVPAVVSDATGVVDSVVDDLTGKIFRVGDAAALANILSGIGDPKDWKRRYGRAARQRVLTHFDQNNIWALQADNLEKQLAGD